VENFSLFTISPDGDKKILGENNSKIIVLNRDSGESVHGSLKETKQGGGGYLLSVLVGG